MKEKNNKGITLIALVITIIILIILAGVGLYLVFSKDGLIEKAKWASFVSNFTEIEERVQLYASDKLIDQIMDEQQTASIQEVKVIAATSNKKGNNYQILPVGEKLTSEEKETIKNEKPELAKKIMQLSEKNVEDVNLYWIDQEKIKTNKRDHYIIDIDTRQIYEYEGKTIYGLRWHTLDGGVDPNKVGSLEDEEDLWDGWMRLTLYYPTNSTNRQWRIGEEGETRYDENLAWQDYTGPFWVKLQDIENVWIRYDLEGEEIIIAPKGRLAVDIQPDSWYPQMVESVKVKIYYDKEASLKEYKIGNSNWMPYEGEFVITENTVVEARAMKKQEISDNEGNKIAEQEIWGRDSVYIANIGIEESELPAPTLTRKAASGDIEGEVAKVEASYPAGAEKKIYKINYGEEKEYTEEISIKAYGTHIIAYYYNAEGKRSKAVQLIIDDTSTEQQQQYIPNKPGKPGKENQGSNPIEPSYQIEAPIITVSPTSVTNQVTVRIEAPKGQVADTMYYKIGEGNYEVYKNSFTLNYNTTITAYYITPQGERSSTARIRVKNIQTPGLPYVGLQADPDPYVQKYGAEVVKVTITSQDAEKVEYSLNGIEYSPYTTPIEIRENTRVYAKGTNKQGESIAYIDINNIQPGPNRTKKLSVWIEVNPEPRLISEPVDRVMVNIGYDEEAEKRYYTINNGELQSYTQPFEVTENCTVQAYAISSNGKGSTSKQIDCLTTGISQPEIIASPGNNKQSSSTTITINFDKTANITQYKINNGNYFDYAGPIEITENCTITAYNSNKFGYEATSSYTVSNIVKIPTFIIDKGNYFLLKLNYPPQSTGREYKWQDDGEWTSYKEDGILLIKPEYKDEILNAQGEIRIKIEDENGNLIDFHGDYYFITKPLQELMEHIYLRWDRGVAQTPTIVLNTEEPAKEVQVSILYNKALVLKQYAIVDPEGNSSGWQEYTGPITVTKKNTIIYARGQDEAEVWTSEAIRKITNIDEEPPKIKVTADLETLSQKVGIRVEVTDDTRVETVAWAQGVQNESYFNTGGNVIPNNSIFYVTENTYYTIYAIDAAGNTSTYTLKVENIDSNAPDVTITVTPNNTIVTKVNISIDYGDSVTKQYKIGENNPNFVNYEEAFDLTSNTVLANNWQSEDGTVTIYARGYDQVGNEKLVSEKILSLDVDAPKEPIITSNYGYPILTQYGVELDGETSIEFDERQDIDNYYSVDGGLTWERYNGSFNIVGDGTVVAKSVKKSSGLEVIVSKEITMPEDALGPAAYDGNEETSETYSSGSKKIYIDPALEEKTIEIRESSSYYGTSGISYYNANDEELSEDTIGAYFSTTDSTKNFIIPKGTSYIVITFSAGFSGNAASIHEIKLNNEPIINVTQYYPILDQYGVEHGYDMITIDYFGTSVQRLYSLDGETWKTYENKAIRLETGETIYAKGIDREGKETRVVSTYTSVLPEDALGSAAYDGDEETSETYSSGSKKIYIDPALEEKTIEIRESSSYYGTSGISYYNANDEELSEDTIGAYFSTTDSTKDFIIPKGTSYIVITFSIGFSGNAASIHEIKIKDDPIISATQHYPTLTQYGVDPAYDMVTIDYFGTSVQRLYSLDGETWKPYENKAIRLEIGETIYAKGIDKNGKETSTISSYTSEPENVIKSEAYDGNKDTYFQGNERDDNLIEVDSSIRGKSIKVTIANTSGAYCYYTITAILTDGSEVDILSNRTRFI